jgi:hypothetical protein
MSAVTTRRNVLTITTLPQDTGVEVVVRGGRLWAVSNPPSGAILRFTLPFEGVGTG